MSRRNTGITYNGHRYYHVNQNVCSPIAELKLAPNGRADELLGIAVC